MTSSEKKDPNKCPNCELYKKELEEKDKKIKILENNLLKIKSLLSESGSLIDGYNEIMEENKQLKEEIEKLKNNINRTNNDNYQFDLLKGKMLRFQQENEKLRSSIQFYESQKNLSLNSKNSNEIKIKRELSLKDKEINQLNTVISILKLKHNEQKMSNDEIIKNFNKGNGDKMIDQDELQFLGNNNNDSLDYNSENEFRNNINSNVNHKVKMIDIVKEKDFLSDQYNLYKQKYIIYKFKYHEFKKTTKLFLNTMKIIPPGNNILDIIDSLKDQKEINLLGNKRLKEKEDNNLFNNMNNIRNINSNNSNKNNEKKYPSILQLPSNIKNLDNDFDNDEDESEEKSERKKSRNKSKQQVKKGRSKKIKKENNEDSNKSVSKSKPKVNNNDNGKNDNKDKSESKRRGRKPKKEKEKSEQKDEIKKEDEKKNSKVNIKKENEIKQEENKEEKENNPKEGLSSIKKEIELKNEGEREKIKEEKIENNDKANENKIKEEHIGPIPKNIKKKLEPMVIKAMNTNNLLNLLSNNPEKITEETINSILSLHKTLHEKINFLFEVIISNLIKIELSRVLTLFEVFIDLIQDDSKTLIGINILENINLHLNTNSLLSKKIHLKTVNKTNETYKTYITPNFSSPIFIISFLLDIIFRKLNDISCLSNFIFKLVFDKNMDEKNKTKILIVLTNTLREKNNENLSMKKSYYKEEQFKRYSSPENENKFYFFLFYKSTLVSNRIFDLILSIYPRESDTDVNIDEQIISKFNNIFNSIPEEQELKIEIPNFPEEYKSSIKFNSNLFYLEIFQALSIIVEIKDIKWISENIFGKILWNNFQKSKKDSLKRSLSIYYTSLLIYLCLKTGIKNHGSENLLEQEEFSKMYGWLYSIYNPQIQLENLISFYDKICALSWIVESPIMSMSDKASEAIKGIIGNIINEEKESLCPSDFLEKVKKLKLI